MLTRLASASVPWALVRGGLYELAKAASNVPGTGAALFSPQGRSYAVVPPKRASHQEVLEHLGKMFNFEGKVAFVSGAAGGLGRVASLAFARSGADVVISEVDEDRVKACKSLVATIQGLGRNVVTVQCDVRDRKSVDAAFEKVDKEFGVLDVLVANAGILGEMTLPQETTEENWRNIMDTNLDGVFHCARAAYPLLKKSSAGGKVVIMSSVAGMTGYGPQAAYCASKGALIPLAKSLALAWAPDRINVNVVLPGAINTPFTSRVLNNPEKLAYILERIPLGRLAEPEDVVGPILFFASHASEYCTGSTLVVDGGGTSRAMAQ